MDINIMNIGVRCHNFGKLPIDEMVEKVSKYNFTCIQLALAKALEGVNSNLGCLSPGMAFQIGNAFRKKDIQIAVLGCYINPVDPDKAARRKQLDRFKEHIRYAREFGCNIVATETGSMNSDMSFTTENHGEEAFKIITESVHELVEEAEKFGVFVGIEGVTKHTINTPQRMKRLIDAIPSNNLQIVLDPVNYMDVNNYKNQNDVINSAFELSGDKIVAIHAKDFIVDGNNIKGVQIGKGILNYELLSKHLKQRKQFINVLMEDSKESEMVESINYLQNIYGRV